jgi:hypothetical protein
VLKANKVITANELKLMTEEALTDLGVSQDKFLGLLFKDVLEEQIKEVQPITQLRRSFDEVKDRELLNAFAKHDTVQSFVLAFPKLVLWYGLMNKDNYWLAINQERTVASLCMIEN